MTETDAAWPTPKPLNRRQRAKARTRERVLKAAAELFSLNGYERSTIRDIAKRAGMSTGAVFANFEDKAHLYETIVGHPPVSAEAGAHLLAVVRGFALNGHELRVEEPWVGALEKLLVMARGRLAQVWPEGLRSDVTDDFRVTPEEALDALARLNIKDDDPAVIVEGPPMVTAGGLLRMARLLEASEPALARELRQRAELRADEAHQRILQRQEEARREGQAR